jgi:transglutaminase-like putative cysteine protease
MIYDVRHLTTVQYAGLVRLARFNLRLKPAPWPSQILQSYTLTIDPLPWTIQEEAGPFLVNRSRMTLRDPISRLSIESCFRVEVLPPAVPIDPAVGSTVEDVRVQALERRDLSPASPAGYLYASPIAGSEAEIAQWSRPFFDGGGNIVAVGRALMEAIHSEFRYDDEATATDTPPVAAFRERRGVCQDFSHIMIIAARAHAIPAAYVSGYLRTLPPPGQPRLVGADATHAWVNLWCGNELGWIGFDPTNNLIVGSDHIFTAMGRDYGDIAPVDGVFHGGEGQEMEVLVDVEPVG